VFVSSPGFEQVRAFWARRNHARPSARDHSPFPVSMCAKILGGYTRSRSLALGLSATSEVAITLEIHPRTLVARAANP
jgi:hypothetical protein